MSVDITIPPDLEERFTPPPEWQSGEFINPETNHRIHYNYALPADKKPCGIVVILPGLSEYGEKYCELMRECLARGLGIYIIDWAYQGRSCRLPNTPHRRSSDGYETDMSDLHYLISNVIESDAPKFMIAHSMGSNKGLRYLIEHPDIFKTAAFSAPMFGIRDLRYTKYILQFIARINPWWHRFYVPGGSDWREESRLSDGTDALSHDPKRDALHQAWSRHNPVLQVGNPTVKWVYESLKSCRYIANKERLSQVKIPIIMGLSSKEEIIDNRDIRKISAMLPNASLIEIQDAAHEILMERDAQRDAFLNPVFEMIEENI